MRNVYVIAGLLLTPLLSGCLGFGGDDAKASEPLSKQRAVVTDSTGGIEGIVTDNAVQPVGGALVLIEELGIEAVTAMDGSYAFSNVAPGTYTLVIAPTGFVPASQTAVVRGGQVSTIDFILVHLASEAPYTALQELNGFLQCSTGVGYNLTGALPDAVPLRRVAFTLAVCSVPNFALENTTNDRFLHEFSLDPPIETLVFETVWDGQGGPLAKKSWIVAELSDYVNGPQEATVFEGLGVESPYMVRVERDHFETIDEWLKVQCETDDTACFSPFDDGWAVTSRFFTWFDCVASEAGACFQTQVTFTHYASAFYNGPAPAGYTTLQG